MHLQQREISIALERSLLQTQQERTIREEQEKLLTMLAHELKTPLATMYMRLNDSVRGSHEIKKAIRDMNNVIDRCQQTLLQSDRQLVPHIESVDIVMLLHNAVSSCAQPERMQLNVPKEIIIQTDPQLFFSVLNNLLENACKYAAPDTPIVIDLIKNSTEYEKAGITVAISNEPGLAGWPDGSMLFNKYYRSPHAKRQTGTGLGMYLVRNLMHTLQGYIEYAPTENSIKFLLYLPNKTI